VTTPAHEHLTELPSYDWCGTDPTSLPKLVPVARELTHAPIPTLLAVADVQLPPVVSPSGVADPDALARLAHPFVVTHAYRRAGWPHTVPEAWLRRSAVDRLASAYSMLPVGFGLAVWDAWRDPLLQAELHRIAYQDRDLAPGFVNPPSIDPARPSPHSTGGTVDLTLTWQREPLNLGTTFDAFVPAAASTAFETATEPGDIVVRNLRRLLRAVMTSAGFIQLDCEWWHFEYGTPLWAAVHETQPIYCATSPDES
jgi:D-alanyl-D-alanine dipeptidase